MIIANKKKLLAFAPFLFCLWVSPVRSSEHIGEFRTVSKYVYGQSLLKKIRVGDKIAKNQRIRTSFNSNAELKLRDDTIVLIGELSDLTLNTVPYDIRNGTTLGSVEVSRGVMKFTTGEARDMSKRINLPNGMLNFGNAVFNVFVDGSGSEVEVFEGNIVVNTSRQSLNVSADKVFYISPSGVLHFKLSTSGKMTSAISKLETAFKEIITAPSIPDKKDFPFNNEKVQHFRNKLFLDLTFGRVVIEMYPQLAPNHVNRIKELVRGGYFDGQIFHNVVSNYVVETGDPTGTGTGGSGIKLNAELSETPFVRGIVGMKRDRDNLDTADSQFFVLLSDAKHLEGFYTVWGRVIKGIELLERLRPGSPPKVPDYILRLQIAPD